MRSLPLIYGIDFSSAPSASKPVMVAAGRLSQSDGKTHCEILSLFPFRTLEKLESFLAESPPWVAAIDMPFGLSRLVTEVLQWPGAGGASSNAWDTWASFYTSLQRSEIREVFKAWCDAHPPGNKFAHRASDRPAKSSPSMKWVNPPVAYMLHAGAALLARLDAHLPGMRPNGRMDRIAIEAYPGFMARQLLGAKSYKHDDARMQTDKRQAERAQLIDNLSLLDNNLQVTIHHDILSAMQQDGKGDALDAVLCILQATLAWMRGDHVNVFDLPLDADPLEGWIVNVPWRDVKRAPDSMDAQAAAILRQRIYSAVSATTLQKMSALGAGVGVQTAYADSACRPSSPGDFNHSDKPCNKAEPST